MFIRTRGSFTRGHEHVSCLIHQGIEIKLQALEKKLEELKAENKPFSGVLKQIIQALCAEEVGFVFGSSSVLASLLKMSHFCL